MRDVLLVNVEYDALLADLGHVINCVYTQAIDVQIAEEGGVREKKREGERERKRGGGRETQTTGNKGETTAEKRAGRGRRETEKRQGVDKETKEHTRRGQLYPMPQILQKENAQNQHRRKETETAKGAKEERKKYKR
jgi:hypothetical protein